MIEIDLIKQYFPQQIRDNTVYYKYIIKEYIQLLILDYLSTTPYVRKLTFIGGTNLRLTRGIDRFSEDIDFDCKDLSKEEFIKMTDSILLFLKQNGYRVETKDRKSKKLKAFRRNIHFPEFLFDLGLSVGTAPYPPAMWNRAPSGNSTGPAGGVGGYRPL